MARSKWLLTGVGVFTIPVKAITLSKDTESNFVQIHADGKCGGRLGRKVSCKKCGVIVPNEQVGIAYAMTKKVGDDGIPAIPDIPFTKEEKAAMHPNNIPEGTIQVVNVIDPLPFKYLNGVHKIVVPQEKNAAIAGNLALFYDGLAKRGKVALVRYFDMGNVYNAIINAQGLMSNVYFAEEVDDEKENDALAMVAAAKVDPAHTTLMVKILKSMEKPLDVATALKDSFTENVTALAMEKQEKGVMTIAPVVSAPAANAGADMMAALTASLALAGETSDEAAPAAPTAAKPAATAPKAKKAVKK